MDYCYTAAIVRKFSASGVFRRLITKKTNVTGLLLDCYLARKARQRLPSTQVVLLQGKKWEGTKAAITTTKKKTTTKKQALLCFAVFVFWVAELHPWISLFFIFFYFSQLFCCLLGSKSRLPDCTAPRITSIRPTLTTSNPPSEPIRFLHCSSNIRGEG